MGGRPQTKSSVSSAGGKQYFWIFALSIQPVSAVYSGVSTQPGGAGSSGPLPTTCTSLSRPAACLDQALSSSLSSMSSTLLLPYSSTTCRTSPGVPSSFHNAWYMGASPVPAHSRVIDFLPSNGYGALMLKLMCLKPTLAPSSRPYNHCETAPPSYRLTHSSNWPSIALSDMGVYGRMASDPSKSSLPFEPRPRPGAFRRTQAQTGSESDLPSGRPKV
mmetsp:Transcript_3421/g.7667  ORF Transcript_3421/g.7667 Transcript_3421/m.7667 type:complete len:218 (+) Transcript_3421:270-923(+)